MRIKRIAFGNNHIELRVARAAMIERCGAAAVQTPTQIRHNTVMMHRHVRSQALDQKDLGALAASRAIDWDDLRFFLELARCRSLTGAADRLGVTQSTVGRRVAGLEKRLGVRLLRRTPEGWACTSAGATIRDRVERIDAETLRIERMVGGLDVRLEGTVRIAAPLPLASQQLASVAAIVRDRFPAIELDLLCDPGGLGPSLHDCDIAVHLQSFQQADLIVRRIGSMEMALYASTDYVQRRGQPDPHAGCRGHDLIAPGERVCLPAEADWLADNAAQARTVLRTNCRETQLGATLQAAGMALLPRFRGDGFASLQKLRGRTPAPAAEVWLAVHREARDVPRIRAVVECIVETMRRRAGGQEPRVWERKSMAA